ncbi:hypothetical protein LG634_36235 [Streptomyces bambusae]|uniref:hypothetical protein n=1 Tax=Streptomyces bambusae TaxID=1550616 RepID=UPI001CFFA132|nr:hypothetical protein [Streptomyces bambusae]MCB5170235.1 hypothetical protein [Streptomyces bambusae]
MAGQAIPGRPRPPVVRHGADWMFGGVYGTVLASALLAALQGQSGPYRPSYDAAWVLVTAVAAGLAHGYAHHMATHRRGSAGHRWRQLRRALLDEWPLVAATLPTVLLLLGSGLWDWSEASATAFGLALNTALLFAWGAFVALRLGYGLGSAAAIGLADAAIGAAIAAANAVIK